MLNTKIMKKLMYYMLAITFSLVTIDGMGNNPKKDTDSNAKVAVLKQKSMIKLIYLNEPQSKVKISILDENGHKLTMKGTKLTTRVVRNIDAFIQPYNFSGLEDGKYIFEIVDDQGTIIQEVDYKRMIPQKAAILTSVYEIGESERFKLSVTSENDRPINVEILNRFNRLIYEDNISMTNSFGRVYNLSKAFHGPFTLRVSNGETTKHFPLK